MKISPARSGSAEFLSMYKDVLANAMTTNKSDPARLFNLRCSQMPYCPRSVALNYAIVGMYQCMDMRMAYYVGVGHAVHHVMQTYLASSGSLLADYDCRECGKKYPFSHKYECCGFPTRYEEVTIDYKGIVGHIDAIFKDKRGRYWIVDFKTTSLKSGPKKRTQPGANYKRQVRAYAYLLWKQYGIRVEGCMLVFLPRDNPWEPIIWETIVKADDMDSIREELMADKRLHKKTMEARTLADFREVFKANCQNPYCDNCKADVNSLLAKIKKNLHKFPIMDDKTKEKIRLQKLAEVAA